MADNEGFKQPVVNKDLCISCHKCEKVCPVLNAPKHSEAREIHGYAATYKDADVLNRSKSGGAFYALAKCVIEQNGVVFGVRWNVKELRAEHAYAETIDELEQFQGSKYVQSEIGESLKQAIRYAKEGRMVLFSGTPCQIAGLYSLCGNNKYDNLILVEVICHGIANQQIFSEYMHWKYSSAKEFTNINMHNKKGGWRHPSIYSCDFKDFEGIAHHEEQRTVDCEYLLACASDDYILRRSCYGCKYGLFYSYGDIILGDFWGVWDVKPELFDNRGVSVVLTLNEKGRDLVQQAYDTFIIQELLIDDLLKGNPYAYSSPNNVWRVKYRRERFFLLRRIITHDFGILYQDDMITSIEGGFNKVKRKVHKLWTNVKK